MAIETMYRCTPNMIKKNVIKCMMVGVVPFIQGSPGCGKSEIIKEIAKEYNLELIDLRLSTCDPTDLSGLPHFTKEGKAEFAPFNVFPIGDNSKDSTPIPQGKDGWLLFLDEFNSASKAVQLAAYKLILDRQVGIHKIHPCCAIVAAGNLSTDRAITNNLSTAMQSRLVHLEMETNFEQWLSNVAYKRNYDKRIIAFLNMFPSKLMDFDPEHNEKTFCCPRTWSFVNLLIKNLPLTNEDIPLLAGTITSGVAVEFVQFCKVFENIIPLTEIIKDPKNARLPDDIALKWAMVTSLIENIKDSNLKAILEYISRFDIPFRVLFNKALVTKNPDILANPTFTSSLGELGKYLDDKD